MAFIPTFRVYCSATSRKKPRKVLNIKGFTVMNLTVLTN